MNIEGTKKRINYHARIGFSIVKKYLYENKVIKRLNEHKKYYYIIEYCKLKNLTPPNEKEQNKWLVELFPESFIKDKAIKEKGEKIEGYKSELKKKITPAEKELMKVLKKSRIKFKFQKAYYSQEFACILDFYITVGNIKLAVEVDGGYHNTPDQKRKDDYRDRWVLKNRGCHTIRFTNEFILQNPYKAVISIAEWFVERQKCETASNFKTFRSILGLPEIIPPPKTKRLPIVKFDNTTNESPF